MFLVLGASSVGKSLLIKRLESLNEAVKKGSEYSYEDMPSTISTVGTNIITVSLNRRHDVTMRELGGCMGPIWKNYFKDAAALIYVIDVSNRLQVAASCIQLLTVLSAKTLPNIPVLIVFNKIDMPDTLTKGEINTLFRLNEIMEHCGRPVQQLDVSACTGKGLAEVVRWLEQNCNAK